MLFLTLAGVLSLAGIQQPSGSHPPALGAAIPAPPPPAPALARSETVLRAPGRGLAPAQPAAPPTLEFALAQLPLVSIDGQAVSLARYQDYLWAVHGTTLYEDFVHRELVERAAASAGIVVETAVVERDFEPFWQKSIAQNAGGESALLAQLEEQGKTRADVRRQYRLARRLERLEDGLCQRTRTLDEAALRARFERDYGKDGVKVELAHVFLNRSATRAELVQEGVPASQLALERIDARIATRALQVLQRLASGEDFALVARTSSHDLSTRDSGGVIAGYNYDRYGEELARAVRMAEVGVPFGPVQGAAGLHVGLLRSRVETKLNDVRDELLQKLARDPASPKERMELRQRLRAAAKVERGSAAEQ